jgi:hypothetical protein
VLVGVLSKDALGPLSIGAVGLTGQGDERDDLEKSDGPNINLLAGMGMVFGAAAFFRVGQDASRRGAGAPAR